MPPAKARKKKTAQALLNDGACAVDVCYTFIFLLHGFFQFVQIGVPALLILSSQTYYNIFLKITPLRHHQFYIPRRGCMAH